MRRWKIFQISYKQQNTRFVRGWIGRGGGRRGKEGWRRGKGLWLVVLDFYLENGTLSLIYNL
jgi:hypothetical protein